MRIVRIGQAISRRVFSTRIRKNFHQFRVGYPPIILWSKLAIAVMAAASSIGASTFRGCSMPATAPRMVACGEFMTRSILRPRTSRAWKATPCRLHRCLGPAFVVDATAESISFRGIQPKQKLFIATSISAFSRSLLGWRRPSSASWNAPL